MAHDKFSKIFYRSHRGGGSAGKILLWIWVKKGCLN